MVWTKKWKRAFIWFSGYFSFLALALVGGYAIVKEDEDLQQTAKQAFIVTLIFTAVTALLSLLSYVVDYGSRFYSVYSVLSSIVSVAEILIFATFIVITLVQKDEE